MKPLVCILAAGKGTRMGSQASGVHKALLPVENRASISRIISQFPEQTQFVVAIGHLGEQVKSYLLTAHPNHDISFVNVKPYEGPHSGPGISVLQCSNFLRRSFFLVCTDTLWSEVLPSDFEENIIFTHSVSKAISQDYCNVLKDEKNRQVTGFRNKLSTDRAEAFTGLAYIKDTEVFFQGILGSTSPSVELFEGFKALIKMGVVATRELKTWLDIGTLDKYNRVRGEVFFGKVGEELFFEGDQVVKYFHDKKIVENRVKRSKGSNHWFPRVSQTNGQFYSYQYEPGHNLYEENSPELVSKLLKRLEAEFWKPVSVSKERIRNQCRHFYYRKTIGRVKQYLANNPWARSISEINGQRVPSAGELLDRIRWSHVAEGVPYYIHGDLQFGNIIYSPEKDRFSLIDWRQDFAGELLFGDIYYDFAKLNAGIHLNLLKLEQGDFHVGSRSKLISVACPQVEHYQVYRQLLMDSASRMGLEPSKIDLLTGLVYLNMAGIHHEPVATMLYSFAIHWLTQSIDVFANQTLKVPKTLPRAA